jgi:hypothetical protein
MPTRAALPAHGVRVWLDGAQNGREVCYRPRRIRVYCNLSVYSRRHYKDPPAYLCKIFVSGHPPMCVSGYTACVSRHGASNAGGPAAARSLYARWIRGIRRGEADRALRWTRKGSRLACQSRISDLTCQTSVVTLRGRHGDLTCQSRLAAATCARHRSACAQASLASAHTLCTCHVPISAVS